jgi:hypothetical protein
MTNDKEASAEQELVVPIHQSGLTETGLGVLPERHDNDLLATVEYTLAEFHYKNGLRVVFSYDELSNDYGLLQEGRIGECSPFQHGDIRTLLEVYLAIAPEKQPIPEELLEEGAQRTDFMTAVRARGISSAHITVTGLEFPITSPLIPATSQTCSSTYYSWWDWHDPATPGMAPKIYYASTFGGKKRYAESYIFNCVPAGSGSWLWARHRIAYKNWRGKYVTHFEGKVAPGTWQEKTKGSIKRWRRVWYDDGWNSSPSNSNLKYTREGRFRN